MVHSGSIVHPERSLKWQKEAKNTTEQQKVRFNRSIPVLVRNINAHRKFALLEMDHRISAEHIQRSKVTLINYSVKPLSGPQLRTKIK